MDTDLTETARPAPDPSMTQDAAPPNGRPAPAPNPGRYTLTSVHAQGGIGRVWLAYDTELGREVALKEVRPERGDSPAVLARFTDEAKITGRLQHPAIIPVYELVPGTDGQRPFYTMRFVRGQTLSDAAHEYHAARQAGTADPLRLRTLLGAVVAVGQAVAYAHSRGVLHRDLKGHNVILGDYGEVIVLDWGLAKTVPLDDVSSTVDETAVSEDDTATRTVQGQVLGTPAYMAPEQAEGRLDLLDARTDVYGLGAILYEILTGGPPFTGDHALKVIHRVIHEPPVPPRRLVPDTPPALEAICLKALAKRREGRYDSAKALAEDVQRFLADEPVSAYPEPWAVRAGRWLRRHRTLAAASAALVGTAAVALAVGVVLLSQANARVRRERERAEANFADAREQRRRAEESLAQAREAAARAEAVNKFLTDDLLGQAAPDRNARGQQVTVETVLNRAATKVGTAFPGQPGVEAAVRQTLAQTYWQLGLYARGEEHARRAVELYEGTRPPGHADTLNARNFLALLLQDQGKLSEAEPLYRQNLGANERAHGPDHQDTIVARTNLAEVLRARGQLDEAESLFRQTLEASRRTHGPDHLLTLTVVNNLASLLQQRGRLPESEALHRQNLEARRRSLGPDHSHTLSSVNNLAFVLMLQGKHEEAEPLFRENLEAKRRILGRDHPDTLTTADNLIHVLRARGRPAEAEPLLREVLAFRRKALPEGHALTAYTRSLLGDTLREQRKFAEAEPLLLEGYEGLKRAKASARRLDEARGRVVQLYEAWGQPEKAAEWKAKR